MPPEFPRSRATGRMMFDSSGTLVWAPEHLFFESNNWEGNQHHDAANASVSGNVVTFTTEDTSYSARKSTGFNTSAGETVKCTFDLSSDNMTQVSGFLAGSPVSVREIFNQAVTSTPIQVELEVTSTSSGVLLLFFENRIAIVGGTGEAGTFTVENLRIFRTPNADESFLNNSGAQLFGPRTPHYNRATLALLGLLIEEARTNRLVYSRDLSQADWVSGGGGVAAVKDATGLDGVANSASTLTASGANGTLIQTTVLGSDERVFSVYARRKTGVGTFEVTDDGGSNWTDVTSEINSSTLVKVTELVRTQANAACGFRLGTSGDEIEVDCCNLTEGAYSVMPIHTTTAPVAAAADLVSSDMAWLSGDQLLGTVRCVGTLNRGASGTGVIWHAAGPSSNYCQLQHDSNGLPRVIMVTGGVLGMNTSMNPDIEGLLQPFDTSFQIFPDDSAAQTNDQTIVTDTDTNGEVPSGYNDLTLGQAKAGSPAYGSLCIESWTCISGRRIV